MIMLLFCSTFICGDDQIFAETTRDLVREYHMIKLRTTLDSSMLVEDAVTIHLLHPVFIQLNHYVFSAHLLNNHFEVTAESLDYSLHNQ